MHVPGSHDQLFEADVTAGRIRTGRGRALTLRDIAPERWLGG